MDGWMDGWMDDLGHDELTLRLFARDVSPTAASNGFLINILKETSNAKSELVLLERTPRLCLRFVLYGMRLVNTFSISNFGVMNYSLLMPNLIAIYAKLNEI